MVELERVLHELENIREPVTHVQEPGCIKVADCLGGVLPELRLGGSLASLVALLALGRLHALVPEAVHHAQRLAVLGNGQAGVLEEALGQTVAGLAEPLALAAGEVQRGGVLDAEDHVVGGRDLVGELAVAAKDVLGIDRVVVEEPVSPGHLGEALMGPRQRGGGALGDSGGGVHEASGASGVAQIRLGEVLPSPRQERGGGLHG